MDLLVGNGDPTVTFMLQILETKRCRFPSTIQKPTAVGNVSV
jgi:hypothetical protein